MPLHVVFIVFIFVLAIIFLFLLRTAEQRILATIPHMSSSTVDI